jgi:hypothetical protein
VVTFLLLELSLIEDENCDEVAPQSGIEQNASVQQEKDNSSSSGTSTNNNNELGGLQLKWRRATASKPISPNSMFALNDEVEVFVIDVYKLSQARSSCSSFKYLFQNHLIVSSRRVGWTSER